MKLLIVDDDDIIRAVVKNIVIEEKLDFEAIEEAENGEVAVEKALQCRPEIIITDIRMPGTDGLSFIERTRKSLQDSKFIILSGYDDFGFAQKAIKFGVCEYLLKPYAREELVTLLKNYIGIINNENELKLRTQNIRRQFYGNIDTLKDKILEKTLEKKQPRPFSLLNRISDITGLDLEGDLYLILYIDIDRKEAVCRDIYSQDTELMEFAVKNIVSELIAEIYPAATFVNSKQAVVSVIPFKGGKQEFEAKVRFLSEKIRYMVNKFLKHTVTICISSTFSSFEDAPEAYTEVRNAVLLKLFKGYDSTFKSSMLITKDTEFNIDTDVFETILQHILNVDEVKLNFEIEKLFTRISGSHSFNPLSIKKAFSKLAVFIYNGVSGQGFNVDHVYGEDIDCWNTISRMEVLGDLKSWVKNFMQSILVYIKQRKDGRKGKNITEALKYINDNYSKDFTLEDIAEMVHLNCNYFSELFKKEVGKNFVDYVAEVRIEKAKKLLSGQERKVSEIAKEVGYRNADYFSKVFKRITGESPRNYR